MLLMQPMSREMTVQSFTTYIDIYSFIKKFTNATYTADVM